jgi:outer membrane biosynthesis protein TonB
MASLRGRTATLGGLLMIVLLAAPAAAFDDRGSVEPADAAAPAASAPAAAVPTSAAPAAEPAPAAEQHGTSDGDSWVEDLWEWCVGSPDPPSPPPAPPSTSTTEAPTTTTTTEPPASTSTSTTSTSLPQEPEEPPGSPRPTTTTTTPQEPEEPPGSPPPTTTPDDEDPDEGTTPTTQGSTPPAPGGGGTGTGFGDATSTATTTTPGGGVAGGGPTVADQVEPELGATGDAELASVGPLAVTEATGTGDSADLATGLLILVLGLSAGAGLVAGAWAISRLAKG